ncbi:metal-dependent hydrolase [Burkholderiaceae bacterium FT117]|uniref:metal-dependent hydrolase n=1 Tax=Zeimonas sediminis TaxID=2944268 RepID=UPI0023432285|nr:metal-dependent hydrolase [Zeimonas sediminis]MCM5572229.1 metal-dependent hydrolase [Zeimonas sediminis]
MSTLAIRRLLIDLETEVPRHWCAGDPFRTAFFDALSMSFPVGEQFFIDAVRNGHKALPAEARARFDDEVKGFVGQEATHRRIHGLFNGHLEKLGYVNDWGPRAARRVEPLMTMDPRHALGITAANEHYTAIFAEWLLRHPEVFDGVEPRFALMWRWHAAEESEHRCMAFDLYQALGGNLRWRRRWMWIVTVYFSADLIRQTASNLRRDGELWRWRTVRSAARFMFGKGGLFRETFGQWRRYFRADFHPGREGSDDGVRWLRENAGAYAVVGREPAR